MDEIFQKLESFKNKADHIMSYFESSQVSVEDIAEVQALFKDLKQELQAEYKRVISPKSSTFLSGNEELFYKPAIIDAWKNTGSVRYNSIPNHKWYGALYDITDYMAYWQSMLTAKV